MQTTIKLFLMDGTITGRIRCSFSSGWNGIAYKIPVSEIDECANISDLKKAGIYFLFGHSENDDTKETVYIGQGNIRQNGQGVLCRIKEPHNQIPQWEVCIIFVQESQVGLGPTELNYLENIFTKLMQNSGRYIVKNGNTPNPSKLSEEHTADMKMFVENSLIILRILGYKVNEPIIAKEIYHAKGVNFEDKVYTFKFKGKAAKGYSNNDGFVLLKGSQIVSEDKIAPGVRKEVLEVRSKFSDKIKDGITIDNIQFNSSSGAAKFCSGQSISGPACWKDSNDISLKETKK